MTGAPRLARCNLLPAFSMTNASLSPGPGAEAVQSRLVCAPPCCTAASCAALCLWQVGGWTVKYDGLTFASVRGAGHMVGAASLPMG